MSLTTDKTQSGRFNRPTRVKHERFYSQLKGSLTTKQYQYATVFVDHYLQLSYLHLQKILSSQETVQMKQAFEKYAELHQVTV